MISLLCALLVQELGAELLEKSPEVRIGLRMKGSDSDAVVTVRRRVLAAREGTLSESWAEVSAALADADRGELRAELTLPQPGSYRLYLGAAAVQVRVSRTDLRSWKSDLDQLRDVARRLEEAADFIDQAGTPTPSQIAQVRRRLELERERVRRMRPDFHATLRAIEESVDRLSTFRTLVKLPERPETVKDYEGRPVPRKDAPETARAELKHLPSVLAREAALLLLDELDFFLTPPPGARELRVLRWKAQGAAIEAIRSAMEGLGGVAGVAAILKDAPEAADLDALRPRLEKERLALLKP